MAARVPVAYENPRIPGYDAYVMQVARAIKQMGADKAPEVLAADEQYLRAAFRAAIDPKTAAAVIFHKHAGGSVIAGELGARCPPGVPVPPTTLDMGRVPMSPVPIAACPPGVVVPPQKVEPVVGSCGPFTKVVRDEAKYAACRSRALDLGSLTSPKSVYALVGPELAHETQEVFIAIGFDVNMTLLCYDEIARGQVDHVAVSPADVLGIVLVNRCKAFLVAHNHPSGDAAPSKDDGLLTERIRTACQPFAGIVFLDHLVIGHGEVYSFTEKKLTKGLGR